MALIKKIDAMFYDYVATTTSEDDDFSGIFTLNSTNTALIEDQDNETLWLNGIPHDRVSLVPKFNLPPKAFSFLKKNILNYFSNNILITQNPSIAVSHDDYSVAYDRNSDISFQKYSSWDSVLNLNAVKPSFISFSKNNENYIVYYYHTHAIASRDDLDKQSTKMFVIKTSDYSDRQEFLELDFPNFLAPFHFDVDNNSILCLRISGSNSTTVTTSVIKLDFAPLSLVSQTNLTTSGLGHAAVNTGTTSTLSHLEFFVGYDSNNNPTVCSFKHGSVFEMKAALIDYSGASPALSTIQTPNTNISPTPQLNSVPANFVQSPVQGTPNLYWSYYPTFDSNNNFIPALILWDKSQDLSSGQAAFSIGEIPLADITYPANTSSQDYIYSDTYNLIQSDIQNFKGNATAYTRLFITKEGTDYFLNHLNVFKRKTAYASMLTQPTSLNLTTFQIANLTTATGAGNLTYLHSIQVDCLDMTIENDDATEIVIISPNSIKILTFLNANTGWSITEHSGIYTNYTKDNLGRRWATKQPLSSYLNDYTSYQSYQFGNLKLIDPQIELVLLDNTLPYTTSIEFSTPNQTYTGSDLPNTVKVNAYDETGQRIQTDVVLSIEGNNMTFDATSGTLHTVQTSTQQDTSVAVTITGPGHISVAASFVL